MNLFDILGASNNDDFVPIRGTDDRLVAALPETTGAPPPAVQDTAPNPPRSLDSVPLSRPRPTQVSPSAAQLGTQDLQAPIMLAAPSGQGDSGLLGAIMGGAGGLNRTRSALAALGAGLAHVKSSPFAAQAFANPLGAALEGGNKDEDRQYQLFTHRLAALDRALRARGIAVNPLGAAPVRRVAPPPAPAQTSAAALVGNAQGSLQGLSASTPATMNPIASARADGDVPELTMAGQGTYEAPYQPQTSDDYAQVERGSFYLHPDGSVRLR